jgi:hypothetical protein
VIGVVSDTDPLIKEALDGGHAVRGWPGGQTRLPELVKAAGLTASLPPGAEANSGKHWADQWPGSQKGIWAMRAGRWSVPALEVISLL